MTEYYTLLNTHAVLQARTEYLIAKHADMCTANDDRQGVLFSASYDMMNRASAAHRAAHAIDVRDPSKAAYLRMQRFRSGLDMTTGYPVPGHPCS